MSPKDDNSDWMHNSIDYSFQSSMVCHYRSVPGADGDPYQTLSRLLWHKVLTLLEWPLIVVCGH